MDMRLNASFRKHAKIEKLYRRLGADGVLALVTLWAYVAEHRPSGVLTDMSEEDIEIASVWPVSSTGGLVPVLKELRLLDYAHTQKTYSIHDWETHQPWVATAEIRTATAKANASKRWAARDASGKRAASKPDADGMKSALPPDCGGDATGNAPSPFPNPSPNPYPNPNPITATACAETEKAPSSPPPEPAPPPKAKKPEPPVMTPVDPVWISFPCDGSVKSFGLTGSLLREFSESFPSLDIKQQMLAAQSWIRAAPERRKTANGMKRYLTSWLIRSQNRGDGRKTGPTVFGNKPKPSHPDRALAEAQRELDALENIPT